MMPGMSRSGPELGKTGDHLSGQPSSRVPGADSPTAIKPERPCDSCRRRKSRCLIDTAQSSPEKPCCTMCAYQKQECTFVEGTIPRKRKAAPLASAPPPPVNDQNQSKKSSPRDSPTGNNPIEHLSDTSPSSDAQRPVELMKNTLGLQTTRYSKFIGPTDEHDISLLDLRFYDETFGEEWQGDGSFRKVGPAHFFHQYEDENTPNHEQALADVETVERLVSPHGEALISLYFQVVHPAFPILHKRTYIEKYRNDYRDFSPAILATVYVVASNWWSQSKILANVPKPDFSELEAIAFRTFRESCARAKISTVQAGLLLLQRTTPASTWQMTSQLVAIGQDLGLHLDCTHWRIPEWERFLRKRLAWAVYMQDTWSALIYGRPPHIYPQNWAVQPIADHDFPEKVTEEAEEDDGTEVRRGRALFTAMIELTKMMSEVLDILYSQKAEMEIRQAYDSTKMVLEKAKPIQLKLRTFFAEMPDTLRLDATRKGKLCSIGYLHLAYFATEITLHRRIIRSLSTTTDPYMVQICRAAAKARLISAMDFFNRLKPEHLQSFWYFASKFNFALIGTFAGLCFVSSVSSEEAEFYQRRLQEYRWTLKVSSKSSEFLEIASGILESAVGVLLRVADDIDSQALNFPMLQYSVDDIDHDQMEEGDTSHFHSGTGADDGDLDDISMSSDGA